MGQGRVDSIFRWICMCMIVNPCLKLNDEYLNVNALSIGCCIAVYLLMHIFHVDTNKC